MLLRAVVLLNSSALQQDVAAAVAAWICEELTAVFSVVKYPGLAEERRPGYNNQAQAPAARPRRGYNNQAQAPAARPRQGFNIQALI